MTTGDRIRILRVNQSLSIRALARMAGMSVGYLAKLEQGLSSPTVAMLKKLADALGVTPADLLSETTSPVEPNLPESLRHFIDQYKDLHRELLDPEWQRALSQVRLRGRYPDAPGDWMRIFLSMQGALED